MNPLVPLPVAAVGAALLIGGAGWSAWRSSAGRSHRVRVSLSLLRSVGALILAVLLINPGTWVRPVQSGHSEWRVLVDRSLSMATEDETGGRTRFAIAADAVGRFASQLGPDVGVVVTPFSTGLEPAVGARSVAGLPPDGTASGIAVAVADTLARYEARPETLRGIVLISDGACVPPEDPAPVAERALAMRVPIHVLPVGGPVRVPDVRVTPRRTVWTVYRGQQFDLVFDVGAQAMPNVALPVKLTGPDCGEEVVRRIGGDDVQTCRFAITAPDEPGQYLYVCEAAGQTGESDLLNNTGRVLVQVLGSKIDVLLIEGLPHWDSKFLAQVLRRLDYVNLTELYRLGADRLHCIGGGNETDRGRALPEEPGSLRRYDVIVLGKAVDSVLSEDAAESLVDAVADGSVLICARGNAARSEDWAPARIVPVVWRPEAVEGVRLRATDTGERFGFFGDRLPDRRARAWKTLPPVPRAGTVETLCPLALVLAEAVQDGSGASGQRPLLAARRWGRGMCVSVGAEGLWQWDFFPKEREASAFYRELWPQLIQWALQFNDFLPGQPFSLRTPQNPVRIGEPAAVTVLARRPSEMGETGSPIPIRAEDDDGVVLAVSAAPAGPGIWEGTLTFARPGLYRVSAEPHGIQDGDSVPRAAIQVLPDPHETADPSAVPDFLERLAKGSEGRVLDRDGLQELVEDAAPGPASLQDTTHLVWRPWWDRGTLLAAAVLCFLLEWYQRRRHMLA